jgi:hypothetical protein
MAKKRKKRHRKDRPPCPDPEHYDWVNTIEGGYWRRKREPILNSVLQMNARNTKITNEAASRVLVKLQPFTQGLYLRRTMAKMAGAFKKSMAANDRMDYTSLQGLDFQERDYKMAKLYKGGLTLKEEKGVLYVGVLLGSENIRRHSDLAEGYFAELILLWGDPGNARTLRVDSTLSESLPFGTGAPKVCKVGLSAQLPVKHPWMAILKLKCLGEYVETLAKYQAMKVIKVGKGFT